MRVAQGGTIRLTATYRDANNALVDPSNPSLDLVEPDGEGGFADLVPTRESLGTFFFDWTAPADAQLGEWTARWSGVIDGFTVSSDDPVEVVVAGFVGPGSLITLEDYKALTGTQPTDTRKDAQITRLLLPASRAVRTYTGRNFDLSTGLPSTRSYQYDGEEMLDIDDAVSVVSLSTDSGVIGQSYDLTADQWTAMPQDDSDVFYYLLILGGPYLGMSPEMGFERNLDRIGLRQRSPLVSVNAVWGWPAIPEDVKLATALTIKDLVADGPTRTEGLTSEAIEGWSRAWGGRQGGVQALTIPNRARDLLVGYQRIFV